jgi:hypothetical protein
MVMQLQYVKVLVCHVFERKIEPHMVAFGLPPLRCFVWSWWFLLGVCAGRDCTDESRLREASTTTPKEL